MATTGEILVQTRAKRAEIFKKLEALVIKEAEDGNLSAEDSDKFTELKNQVDEHDMRIGRLEAVQQASMDAAEPINCDMDDDEAMNAGKRSRLPHMKGIGTFNIRESNEIRVPRTSKDTAVGRYLTALYYVKESGRDNARRMVEQTWGDAPVAKALTLTTAQPLIPQDFSLELIPLLTADSVVRKFATVRNMSRGNLTIPRASLGSTAAYLSEGAQIPVSAMSFDNIQMSWHKYGAFTYTTREMLAFSPLDASAEITAILVKKTALLEDLVFLTGNGSNYPVKGIISQVASGNVFQNSTSSGAVTFQTVSFDLQVAETNLTGNFVNGDFVWIMSPFVKAFLKQLSSSYGIYPFKDELDSGYLNGFKVYTTRQLATNLGTSGANLTNILLVNPSDCIIGDAYSWNVTMSTEGSLIDGTTEVNLFSQDLVGYKLTNAHDFALKHNVSATVLQASGWSLGATGAGAAEYDQAANTSASTASSAVD